MTLPNLAFLRGQEVHASTIVRERQTTNYQAAWDANDVPGRPGEKEILAALSSGLTTRRALQEATGFSLTKTRNILNHLVETQRIRRDGKGKNVRYVLQLA